MREFLLDVLLREGYEVEVFAEAQSALAYLSQSDKRNDLMLTDIGIPGTSGLDLLQTVKTVCPELPVILLSGLYEQRLALAALKNGAADYLVKPVKAGELTAIVRNHLRPDTQRRQTEAHEILKSLLENGGRGSLASAQVEQVFWALGLKRSETREHCERVAALAVLFGKELGLSEPQLVDLELGALLHDIGKIAVPHNLLQKNGPLTPPERTMMALHPQIGFELLAEFPQLAKAAQVAYGHHERFDGQGYPRGLSGEQIPVEARIFSIVDTFDAITSERPYRLAQSAEMALSEIKSAAGKQLDPVLVDVFLKMRPTGDRARTSRLSKLVERLPSGNERSTKTVKTELRGVAQCAGRAAG